MKPAVPVKKIFFNVGLYVNDGTLAVQAFRKRCVFTNPR